MNPLTKGETCRLPDPDICVCGAGLTKIPGAHHAMMLLPALLQVIQQANKRETDQPPRPP
jgi:hypothetical protein